MTKLKGFNFFILQWFFVRLGRGGEFDGGVFTQTCWLILFPILPLTGWFSDFFPRTYISLKVKRKKITGHLPDVRKVIGDNNG